LVEKEKSVALRLEQKQEIVAEVNDAATSALSAVLADYRGLTVAEMTELRVKARETGECLNDALVGPTLLAFSTEDPGSAARLLKDYAKDFEELEIKALSIGGALLPADQIDRVAKLPTLDEARSQLMSVMQAPIIKLAQTLNEVPGKMVRVVAAVKDQKEAEA
jgi:large subunit ribosomal protein L10